MACINLNLNSDVSSCLSGMWAWLRRSRPKSGIQQLEKEMARLRGKRDDIKNQIEEAERDGKFPTNEVNQWLRKVEELEGQVVDINQDFQSMSCFSCNCFNRTGGVSSNRAEAFSANLEDEEDTPTQTKQAGDHVPMRESPKCCSINRRVMKKLGEANELMSQAGVLVQIATVQPPEPTLMLPILHRPPVGINSYVKNVLDYINGGEGNIIGIYGMGGVGKTTILKSIQRCTTFDRVIWIVASKDCQLKRLQMKIAESLKLMILQESDDEQTCGDKLFRYLKHRKCLLLLDDIWEHVDLQLLGMPLQRQDPLKVVVFTTRSQTVCAQMKAQKKIKVKCLDPNQAWQLFKENIDCDVLSSDKGIDSCAQELAKECAGLLLALITVARAMLGKISRDDWNHALHQIRDKHECTTIGVSEDSVVMYKAFKLSYDSLENDSIRECLLCCALWPQDYEINKFDELIPCWIGCGIIHEFNVINEAFTQGCSHLNALIAASLLEDSRWHDVYEAQYVKMHDVIREMALLMVSGLKGNGRKWVVKAGIGLSNLPRQEEWKEAERASFMDNEITSLQDYRDSTFPKLSMLILHHNDLWRIPPTLFTNMPLLTYLDISESCIKELPMEVCSLTELQYLNLSNTCIRSLPLEFGRLSKLEYFLLRYTNLETVPNGTISNLLMLKWQDITQAYDPICEQWWDELIRFRGRHQTSLTISISPDDLERLKMLPNFSVWNLTVSKLTSSEFPKYDVYTALLLSHRVSDNLEYLTISDFPVDKGVDCELSFRCLKTLNFESLAQLEKLWLNGVGFNNLRDLRIGDCPMLKDVSFVLQLPFLKLLAISECPEMKELISNFGSSNSSFGIRMVSLNKMKNLHRIAHQPLHFPYLEYVHVHRCPMFKKLPFGAEILNNILKEIAGERDWWNNLDWDDQTDKDSLTPYFFRY